MCTPGTHFLTSTVAISPTSQYQVSCVQFKLASTLQTASIKYVTYESAHYCHRSTQITPHCSFHPIHPRLKTSPLCLPITTEALSTLQVRAHHQRAHSRLSLNEDGLETTVSAPAHALRRYVHYDLGPPYHDIDSSK